MSVEHLAICLHHSRAKGTAKLILLGIANHHGDGGSWPAVGTLAKYANVDERSVQRSLDKLVSLGELVVHDRPGTSNLYELRVMCPGSCDRTPNHRTAADRHRQQPLWITRGDASVTPGTSVTPTPGTSVTPPPAPASPEPSINHQPEPRGTQVSNQQTARARPCIDCGQGPAHPWHGPDDHSYRASRG